MSPIRSVVKFMAVASIIVSVVNGCSADQVPGGSAGLPDGDTPDVLGEAGVDAAYCDARIDGSSNNNADGGGLCGDGTLNTGEACDDGNPNPGDGCDASCGVEPGYSCVGEPSVCTSAGSGVVLLHSAPAGVQSTDIYTMVPDGTGLAHICGPLPGQTSSQYHFNNTLSKITGAVRTQSGADEVFRINVDCTGYLESSFQDPYGASFPRYRDNQTIWLGRNYATSTNELFQLTDGFTNVVQLSNFAASGTEASEYTFGTTRICYRKQQGSASATGGIYCANLDLTNETLVPGGNGIRPSISPDETLVLYQRFPGGEEILRANSDGSGAAQTLYTCADHCAYPLWSPDGAQVMFSQYDGAQWDIWVMEADGSSPLNVTGSANMSEVAYDWR